MCDSLLAGLIHKHSPSFERSGTGQHGASGYARLLRIISRPLLQPAGRFTNILRRHIATSTSKSSQSIPEAHDDIHQSVLAWQAGA